MKVTVRKSGTQGQGMTALLKDIKTDKGVRGYKVGWPAEAKYPDGTPVVNVALWNEFGVPENGLPERPFFRNANQQFKLMAPRIIKSAAENGRLTASGNEHVAQAHVSMVQSSIRDIQDPPNTASTVSQKGSSNPLIDTGLMRRTLTYEPLK